MKVLVIQTAFLGDVVLATPILEALRAAWPHARLDMLVRKGNESLLAAHPHLHRVWVWDKKQGKYRTLLRLLRHIRAERFDMVVNCQRFGASGLLTALSGAAERIGFDKNPLSFLFTHRLPHRIARPGEPAQHEVDRNLSLIAHRVPVQDFRRPRLYPSAEDVALAQSVMAGTPYICIAPTSVWFTKQWPAHKWVELINRMPPSLHVALLGAPADHAACEAIRSAAHRQGVYNLAGKLSLLQSAALMGGAAMNYVNDSAPLHLASAMNAPVAAVFCSTVPAFGFGPLSDRRWLVETRRPLECRPCGLHGYRACPLGHFLCAESIETADFPLP